MELCQSVKRPQTHSKYLKKTTTFIWSCSVSFCFTNHLIHNQVGYASSEIHDSTQRKEIFPTTKTYCSFNKDFARLLILMQSINKLYLFLVKGGSIKHDHLKFHIDRKTLGFQYRLWPSMYSVVRSFPLKSHRI